MSRSKKSPMTPQKKLLNIKIRKLPSYNALHGFAVVLIGCGVMNSNIISKGQKRTEFWLYDPKVLTQKQRDQLGIVAWTQFVVEVKEDQHG